jgi:glyoxylase-like metal-dependent hydrolase (beta-lactamase superfamily II)
MDLLWGEMRPVAAERVRVLKGGETVGPFEVAYTPGHASHHVSYLHRPSGRAFTGDVAGVRIEDGPVFAPTPPPDIDLELWRASLDAIEAWRPSSLGITHFGSVQDVPAHLASLRARLDALEQMSASMEEEQFTSAVREELARTCAPETAATYERATPPSQSFRGLARYLQRRAAG